MPKCGIAFCNIPVTGNNTYCSIRHGFLNDKKAEAVRTPIKKVSEKRSVSELKEILKNGSTISKKKKTGVNDDKLWKAFSEFIRLRDSDENGVCTCITCGLQRLWTKMDCGHGISRQHWGTRYNEKNNHSQCKKCNGFEGGKREIYKLKVDERYGAGTWDLLELASKKGKKPSQFEVDQLEKHYRTKSTELKKLKNLK